MGFCDGLVKSRCFVPILSKATIESRFAALNEASYCDNVLLEHRLVVELQHRGLLERVFPVLLGDAIMGGFAKYAFTRTASQLPVDRVETKLRAHLDRQSLGAPLETRPTVAQVLQSITKCQGGKVEGTGTLESLLEGIADKVQGMVAGLDRAAGAAGGGGGGGGGVVGAADSRDVQIAELEQQLCNASEQLSSTHSQLSSAREQIAQLLQMARREEGGQWQGRGMLRLEPLPAFPREARVTSASASVARKGGLAGRSVKKEGDDRQMA